MYRKVLVCGGLLSLMGAALAQANDSTVQGMSFSPVEMHFSPSEMDTNGDHMVTREEMMAYAEKTWQQMAQGRDSIPIEVAAKDFASGGVNFSARAIDTDHDGTISKAEYLAYAQRKFAGMKKTHGMVPVEEMTRALLRGDTNTR